MEVLLQNIMREKIKLRPQAVRLNNYIFKKVIKTIRRSMCKESDIFAGLDPTFFFVGGYFEGLKVSEPDEYDLMIFCEVPADLHPKIEIDRDYEYNSYVKIKFRKYRRSCDKYASFFYTKFIQNDYFFLDEFKSWIHSIFQKALNKFYVPSLNVYRFNWVEIRFKTGRAAFTLDVLANNRFIMNIDLVPCFKLSKHYWPDDYRFVDLKENYFFLVPRGPKSTVENWNQYWTLNFQIQERLLIFNKMGLKPSIRLIKYLRDVWELTSLKSFFIKQAFLWHVDEDWHGSLTECFIQAVEILLYHIEQREILQFWNKQDVLKETAEGEMLKWELFFQKLLDEIYVSPIQALKKYFK